MSKQSPKPFTRTQDILKVMYILTWVVFIGFLIQAGAILISYSVSWAQPVAARDLYQGMGLYPLRQFSFAHYTIVVALMVILLCLKAGIALLVTRTLSQVNLRNPFTMPVVRILERISYVLLCATVLGFVHNTYAGWLRNRADITLEQWPGASFLAVAGLVFVIAQLFRRGVELQTENDLTV